LPFSISFMKEERKNGNFSFTLKPQRARMLPMAEKK
jgi:hypothetical protein